MLNCLQQQKIQADCDVKATNIILQGLPSDIYALVNHHRVTKDLWERVQLLMDLHTTNFDQLHAYLQQLELHANEVLNQQILLTEFPQIDSGLAVPVFKQGRPNAYDVGTSGTRANTLGTEGNNSGNGKVLNEEELEFLVDPSIVEGPVTQSVITHNATYQVDDLDAYDSDCDEISTGKVVLMANLSSYSLDVLSKVPYSNNIHNDMLNQSVQEMPYSEQTHIVNYLENEINSDSNIIPYSQYLLETQNETVQDINYSAQQDAMIISVFEQLSQHVTNCNKVNKHNLIANESLSVKLERYKEQNAQFADFEKEFNSLKQTLFEQLKEKESLTKTFNVLKNESKEKEVKNIDKEIALEKKVKELDIIIYKMETNVISITDFEETLMLEEESRSKMLLKQSDLVVLEKKVNIKPMNYDVLNQLSKDFGKHFFPQQKLSADQAFWFQMSNPTTESFDASPIKVDVPSELPNLQAKDTTIEKLKENIKCLNKTSTTNNVKKDIDEIETINIELEHIVAKLIAKNEHLKQTYKQLYDSIKPSCVRAKEHTESLVIHLNQKKLKGKDIVDNAAQVSNDTTLAPGMYKLDLLILAPSASYTAYKYVKLIQELLGYVRDICLDIHKCSKKLVAVTPINKKKIVRFAEHVTSSRNNPKVTDSYSIQVSSSPLLSSTGVKHSTSASGSQPLGNTKNDRISRPPSCNEKNKVEVQFRKVKSSLNKKNFDSKNVYNEHVKHSVKGDQAISSNCKECLVDANHAMCLIDHINDVNTHSKSKSVKNAKKKEEWKPTGKVFTKIRYTWRPTGRTFTLVENAGPLTRITATNKVPLREPIPLKLVAQKPIVTKVYTRRPKVPKAVGSYSKPKIAKSMISNKKEPGTSRGSNTSVVPSSSLVNLGLSKLFFGIWTLDAQSM
ncbi:hypothetical protein Tco_0596817 [Tanacetum coccineum]